MPRYESVLEAIGNTPEIRLRNLYAKHPRKKVYVKCERFNPGGSIKDRIGFSMIQGAEDKGVIQRGVSEIVEPTSGNNGIGLAITAALKGYPLTLVIPGYYSVERRRIMAAYGARVEVTPADQGVMAALYRAIEITKARPQAWMPNQFENPDNVRAHRLGTAEEIFRDFPEGVDYIITGAGSGGHITGVAETLKAKWPNLKVFCTAASKSRAYEASDHKVPVQFADPNIAPGEHVGHLIQGMSAGAFIPKNLDMHLVDGIIYVTNEEAYDMCRRIAREEGLFVGSSTGASLAAVHKKLPEIPDGATVLTFNYDIGDRYLSMDGLFTDENVHNVEVNSVVVAPPKHAGAINTDPKSKPAWWPNGYGLAGRDAAHAHGAGNGAGAAAHAAAKEQALAGGAVLGHDHAHHDHSHRTCCGLSWGPRIGNSGLQ